MLTTEILNMCRYAQAEIKELKERRQALLLSLLPSGMQPREVDVQTSAPGDRMAEAMAAVCDLDAEITRQIVKLVKIQRDVQADIDRMENPRHRLFLNRYYMSGDMPTYEELADELGIGVERAYNVRANAVRELDAIRRTRNE